MQAADVISKEPPSGGGHIGGGAGSIEYFCTPLLVRGVLDLFQNTNFF